MTAATAVMALLAGRLVPRLGEWPVLVAGLSCGAAGATLVVSARDLETSGYCSLRPCRSGYGACDACHDGPCDEARREVRAWALGGRLQTHLDRPVSVGRGDTRRCTHRRFIISLRPAFVLTACAYGLAVALAAVARRRDYVYSLD